MSKIDSRLFSAHNTHLECIQLPPPPHFEGQEYPPKLSFKNFFEIRRHKETLNRIVDDPALEKLLR